MTAYFWKAGTVVTLQATDTSAVKTAGLTNLFCVDTTDTAAERRYGKYHSYGWKHYPLTSFPKEFRVHLMLLGVG